jgi:hypothetical protein
MSRLSRCLLLAGFILLIFGGKLWLISFAGSDLPVFDQWDAEGNQTFRPWLEHSLDFTRLARPHNEHRIVTVKLYALGLLALNGEWDAFVETTCNAAIHTFCAVVLLLLARRWLGRRPLILFGAFLVALFTLPFSWENSLAGFQVAFYFFLLFSIGHIALTFESDRFGARWVLGQLCGFLALITLASGFFSALAILAVAGWRFLRTRHWTRQCSATVVLAAAFTIAGILMMHHVPGHDVLRSHTAGEFMANLGRLLTWPGQAWLPWSLLLLAPAAWFVIQHLRRRDFSATDAGLLGLLAWEILQCLATAYARTGPEPASRYLDLLALNLVLGFVFLFREFTGRARVWLALGWLVAVIAGLAHETSLHWRLGVLPRIPYHRAQEKHLRAYLQFGDPREISDKSWPEIPYPDPRALLSFLASPQIRAIMPPSVRRAVTVAPPSGATPPLPPDFPTIRAPIALSTWSAANSPPVSWRSAAQPASSLPILRFFVAGDLGRPGHPLRLVVKSASGETPVQPETVPGRRWKTVNVFRPAGPWWIEAADADPNGWFAFTEPIEVGRLGWAAEKLLKHHGAVILAGVSSLLLGALFGFAAARRGNRGGLILN